MKMNRKHGNKYGNMEINMETVGTGCKVNTEKTTCKYEIRV
jgi:hypothetical protein